MKKRMNETIISMKDLEKGVWVRYMLNKYTPFLIKFKTMTSEQGKATLHALYLSVEDPESMSLNEYTSPFWKVIDNNILLNDSSEYRFGEHCDGDTIYNEDGHVIEEELVKAIMEGAAVTDNFVEPKEVREHWHNLQKGKMEHYPLVEVNAS